MTPYDPYLHWIDAQAGEQLALLQAWANLNTGTANPLGLHEMADLVHRQLHEIADSVSLVPASHCEHINHKGHSETLSLGPNVVAHCRREAPVQVLLSIHMDTVYGPDSPFQSVKHLDDNTLHGPGVADAKGGLVVLLYSLKAFERFVRLTGQKRVGWEVVINSDEEIGSPGSSALFADAANRVQLGLLFEPSLPHGGLISTRKGTGNFSIIAHGQSAHSGRDFHLGRNAVVAAAAVSTELHQLNGRWPGLTLNVARIDGGGPNNMVPALAIIRLNIRYTDRRYESEILAAMEEILARISTQTGVALTRHGQFLSPPKVLTPALEAMLTQVQSCGKDIGLDLSWGPSGGASDGNRLAALGIPNIDTLGVRGGKIHSHDEFALIDSLPERTKLTTLFLMHLADGLFSPPRKEHNA